MKKLLGASIVGLVLLTSAQAQHSPLRLVGTIPLPEVEGRIDHFSVDVSGQRAFLAALAKNTIEVVDLKAGRVSRSLTGFPKPQGVLYVPELKRLFVATGKDGALRTLDGETLEVIRTTKVSLGADGIGYDPRSKEIYLGSGGSDANQEMGDLTVFNAVTGERVAALTTDAHAGGSIVDEAGDRMLVYVADKAQVVAIDRRTHAQIAKWTLPGVQKDVALALDSANHRLFAGVRTPASIVIVDTLLGKTVATVPTVATLDGLSFDPATHRIYTSGAEGFLDVTQQTDADHYERIARIPTGPVARTSVFVPEWRKVLVAVPKDGSRQAELRIFEVVP